MADLPETEAFRAFAARLGSKPSYVTELKKTGRLVLTEDGRRVRVAESLQLIAATRNPAKAGVAARHAAARDRVPPAATPGDIGAQRPAPGDGQDEPEPEQPPSTADPLYLRRTKAQAEREEALARKALREEQVEMGALLPRDEVLSFVADAIVQLRSRLELMPSVLSPQLAATDDEDAIRVQLRDGIEQTCTELARKFDAIGKVDQR
jgi:hypothetical protein